MYKKKRDDLAAAKDEAYVIGGMMPEEAALVGAEAVVIGAGIGELGKTNTITASKTKGSTNGGRAVVEDADREWITAERQQRFTDAGTTKTSKCDVGSNVKASVSPEEKVARGTAAVMESVQKNACMTADEVLFKRNKEAAEKASMWYAEQLKRNQELLLGFDGYIQPFAPMHRRSPEGYSKRITKKVCEPYRFGKILKKSLEVGTSTMYVMLAESDFKAADNTVYCDCRLMEATCRVSLEGYDINQTAKGTSETPWTFYVFPIYYWLTEDPVKAKTGRFLYPDEKQMVEDHLLSAVDPEFAYAVRGNTFA